MILVLGGTSEGRSIAEGLIGRGYETVISVTSEYGRKIIEERSAVLKDHLICGPLDAGSMASKVKELGVNLLVDATHPFATDATANARRVAREMELPYLRYKRPGQKLPANELIHKVHDFKEAALLSEGLGDVIFLTIGSNHLGEFMVDRPSGRKIICRVLPTLEAVGKCLDLGLPGKNIIAAQGPFSTEFNVACFKEHKATALVTKNSGGAGGITEKIAAALLLSLNIVVVENPEKGEGYETFDELLGAVDNLQADGR